MYDVNMLFINNSGPQFMNYVTYLGHLNIFFLNKFISPLIYSNLSDLIYQWVVKWSEFQYLNGIKVILSRRAEHLY